MAMLERNPNQKIIFAKESNVNFSSTSNNDPSIFGLFKSTSSLARSLRQVSTDASSSSLKSSGALIINSINKPPIISTNQKVTQSADISRTFLKPSVSSSSSIIQIRNIIHNYSNIDVNPQTYKVLSELRIDKRMLALNMLEDYENWKSDYASSTEEAIKNQISNLKNVLNNTQDKINSKFTMSNEELVPLMQSDIDDIKKFYYDVIKSRDSKIEATLLFSMDKLGECLQNVKFKIMTLGKDLDLNGYYLEEEIEKIANDKNLYISKLIDSKKSLYNRVIAEVRESEREIIEKSGKGLIEFVLRWKNVKLNFYITELKDMLNSKDIVDNKERYDLIENLKRDQIEIYEKRKVLIFEKAFKLEYNKINTRTIEKMNKQLDDIDGLFEKLFLEHVQLLEKNSEKIQKISLFEIEKFKEKVKSVSYEFGKDNHNEKKYNDYEDLNSIDELIEKEIKPILSQNEQDRIAFNAKINHYIDEYDEYMNNMANRILSFLLSLGKLYDEHKKKLNLEDKQYQLDIAKLTDNDEEVINSKEEALEKEKEEMRNCINKQELDKGLENCFKIYEELEVEYRDFFKNLDEILNSHEGRFTNSFHDYEIKVLQVFGMYVIEKREEIEKRRNEESNFLSCKKEAEIAYEEAKKAEEEAKEDEKAGKKPKQPKKQEKKPDKKGEQAPLVPPREIKEFKSKMGFDYLIDFTIDELVRHFLRNVIYNRDDDIYELKPKTPEELERIQKEKEEKEKEEQEAKDNPKAKKNPKNEKTNQSPNEESTIDYYNAFDPYNADTNKVFMSPMSLENTKLLSEANMFNEENLVEGMTNVFNLITDSIIGIHQNLVDKAKTEDNENREEKLTDLDILLKSLPPKKGKTEVEVYDKRLNEIEKHEAKLKLHKEQIEKKNTQDENDNESLLTKIGKNFDEIQNEYDKLSKGIEEEETMKGLEEKYNKFKMTYYDFISRLSEYENDLLSFSQNFPQSLLRSNENYILSLQPISKGGTYSNKEIEFTKGELDNIDQNMLKVSMEERKKKNAEKIEEVKKKCDEFLLDIEKKYATASDNIMAKDGIGKKFGAPKRMINDIIINIKIKCNQAQEGLDMLLKQLNDSISNFNKLDDTNAVNDELLKNALPITIRKQLSKINACVFYYGKYIQAFQDNIMQGYELSRVLMKENVESCEIVNKEDIEEDEKLKKEELSALGFLAKNEEDDNQQQGANKGKGLQSGNEQSYNGELASIDDKAKTECAKIYVGNYAKFINQQEKMPDSLVSFIANIKNEMEKMRLNCVRNLRTFCQNLLKSSYSIPLCVIRFIYLYSGFELKNTNDQIVSEYNSLKEKSIITKSNLERIIGPYLANPYYKIEFDSIEKEDNDRNKELIECLNKTQFSLIENEEKNSKEFTIRLLNNFESLMILFDNFIFEEEFISLGDEEYFKFTESYNELLKLKERIEEMGNNQQQNKIAKGNVDASNLDLQSKRTFKKIYKGINLKTSKINYFDLFRKTVCDAVENSEEKIKELEEEYTRDDFSKNITGIKLDNNKILFLLRNEYYVKHCEQFNKDVIECINKYNNERFEELESKQKWDKVLEELKNTMNLGIHKDDVVINES